MIEPNSRYDLLIIGGGVNGTGIARDAAGRGLKVLLIEQADLASATSSSSTKLIHGGLRYLEYYEFRLVREALIEREILLNSAPHIIWPLRFILPHDRNLRPAWMIRLGLFLYDHLGGRKKLPPTESVHRADGKLDPLQARFRKGFAYSDCWVDDARLVLLNALDAKERGAEIHTHTRFLSAKPTSEGFWLADIEDEKGKFVSIQAKALVNAAGPWVAQVLEKALQIKRPGKVRLVKGSHIIVPQLFPGRDAFILQNKDKRIIFAIPYEQRFTLIGTTDIPFEGDPARVAISEEETLYLCQSINQYMRKQITPSDVIRSYTGVRPLFDDDSAAHASAVTRDYVLDLTEAKDKAPLLNIYGGKITTYRRLAEHALEKLQPYFPKLPSAWTKDATLPGGDIPGGDFEAFVFDQQRKYDWLTPETVRRLARAYGTRMDQVLGNAKKREDLGRQFGGDFYEREAEYMIQAEWARDVQDILWRRSKLGLHLPRATQENLAAWLAERKMDTGPGKED